MMKLIVVALKKRSRCFVLRVASFNFKEPSCCDSEDGVVVKNNV